MVWKGWWVVCIGQEASLPGLVPTPRPLQLLHLPGTAAAAAAAPVAAAGLHSRDPSLEWRELEGQAGGARDGWTCAAVTCQRKHIVPAD